MKRVLKGATLLTANHVFAYGLSFLRNLILARTLAKADYGLSAAFATTVSLLELAGRLSFGHQIVQAKHDRLDELQSTLHAFLLAFGSGSAALFILFSKPIAAAFKVPDLWWAFATLGAIPLLKGIEHLDNARQRRELNFTPSIIVELVPQALVTAATWPVVTLLPDFRAILVLMVAKSLCTTALTHVLSLRSYRVKIDRSLTPGIYRFSGPLLLNGFVMFAAQQADQMLIGFFLSLEDLATYSVVFSIVSIPWFIVAQVSSSLMLPVLARHQDSPIEFHRKYRLCLQAAVGASFVTICPLVVGGELLIRLVYGTRYADTGLIVAILGSTCTLRFLRLAPAIAALSRADTVNQLFSNLVRSVSLPIAAAAALMGTGLVGIAVAGVVGELVATIVSFARLHRLHSVPLHDTYMSIAALTIGLVGASILRVFAESIGASSTVLSVAGFFAAAVVISRIFLPHLHEVLWTTLSDSMVKFVPQKTRG